MILSIRYQIFFFYKLLFHIKNQRICYKSHLERYFYIFKELRDISIIFYVSFPTLKKASYVSSLRQVSSMFFFFFGTSIFHVLSTVSFYFFLINRTYKLLFQLQKTCIYMDFQMDISLAYQNTYIHFFFFVLHIIVSTKKMQLFFLRKKPILISDGFSFLWC